MLRHIGYADWQRPNKSLGVIEKINKIDAAGEFIKPWPSWRWNARLTRCAGEILDQTHLIIRPSFA